MALIFFSPGPAFQSRFKCPSFHVTDNKNAEDRQPGDHDKLVSRAIANLIRDVAVFTGSGVQ